MFSNCYHFCTTALKDRLLFADENDYSTAWNTLAISAIATGVKIYCLCLMSNHLHILLAAPAERIADFFRRYKQKMGMIYKNSDKNIPLDKLNYELFPVKDRKAFCQEVAYIIRNPYKAGISAPMSYRWSSACTYFNPYVERGTGILSLTNKSVRILLKTRAELPDTLRLIDNIIAPISFIDYQFVERMFDASSIMFFNLIKNWNLETVVRESHGISVPDTYTDEEVQREIAVICRDTLKAESLSRLDRKALGWLVRKVHARFGSTRGQLLRVLPVDDFFLDRVL